jgi:type IX secretion system PorP/SprF family membrane protein
MGRLLLTILTIFLFASGLRAQYVPGTNQPFQYAPVFNPAFSGIEGYKDLKLGYRYQWTGFGAGAPKWLNLTYNFRLKEPLDLNLHALRTNSSLRTATSANKQRTSNNQRRPDELPALKRAIHGFGVNVYNESLGPIKRVGGGINYAFHYPLTKDLRLSGGVGVIVDNTRIDLNALELAFQTNPDPFWMSMRANGANHTDLSVRAGVLLYSSKFYLGFSYLPVYNAALKTSEVTGAEPFYKGTIMAGVALPLSPTLTLKPSVLALWQTDNKFAVDYNAKMYIEQKIWFGATYRSTRNLVALLGFNLNEMLGASYCYEISTGGMQQFSDGSHELVLSLRLNNFKRLSPQTW